MNPIDGDKLQEVFREECACECACCLYGIFDKADFKGCKLIEDAPTIKEYAGCQKELKELRMENEVILRRLKHLLESDYISQFDQVDPNTKEYIRNIKEADWKVMYLCDQQKSCNVHCKKDHYCKRTSDISHAKNFRIVPNGMYPIIYEEVDEHCIASVWFDRAELKKIVDEQVIEPIKNGELVIKEKRPHGEWIVDQSPSYTGLYMVSIDSLVTVANFDGRIFRSKNDVPLAIDAWMPLPKPYKEAENE